MEKIDKKQFYSLLCDRDFLQYLSFVDKLELNLTCKFIFQNCKRYRFSNYTYKEELSSQMVTRVNSKTASLDKIANQKIHNINGVINTYRNYVICLKSSHNDNFYILEYFSKKFTYLNSLYLAGIVIPKETLKNILRNLPYLNNLSFIDLILTYSKNNKNIKFQYPKRLTKLNWENCIQFECDIKDSNYLTRYKRTWLFNFFSFMNISIESINSLKSLAWYSNDKKELPILGEILDNNVKLGSLEVSLHSLDSNTLSNISNNSSISHLTINSERSRKIMENNNFKELPSIKSIEVRKISKDFTQYIHQIILCCPNLEKLKYYTSPGSDDQLLNLIQQLPNLNSLTIIMNSIISFDFSINPFPTLNLEYLEFNIKVPCSINLNHFDNLGKLKCIKLSGSSELFNDSLCTSPTYDKLLWREFKYLNSIQYWKILKN